MTMTFLFDVIYWYKNVLPHQVGAERIEAVLEQHTFYFGQKFLVIETNV